MKDKFVIEGLGGHHALKGEIKVHGMKNAILPLLASAILFDGPVTFTNVPDIEDVHRMSELLIALGARVSFSVSGSVTVDTTSITTTDVNHEIAKRMRASMVVNGPLLARFGAVSFPHPGGCVLGNRPIDIMMKGFTDMGAVVHEKEVRYEVIVPKKKMRAIDFFFRVPSVTTTETFLMAAVLGHGEMKLHNVALEPEVSSLAEFLVSAGAKIYGIGTPTLTIVGTGGVLLHAPTKSWKTIPDRIEAGSFVILGALAGTDVTVTECEPAHLDAVIEMLREANVTVEVGTSSVRVITNKDSKPLRAVLIKTHEYPGFPTDLQAPATVLLTQAEGESLVHETIFDGRLNYTADLVRMGADIKMWDAHRALVKGPTPLKGRELDGPDIRAGLAYVIAAIVANGQSIINNVYYIDRGYEHIEQRLKAIGVAIKRISSVS